MARNELARWGIAPRFYDPMDAARAGRDDRPGARKLVWLEAPGSVTMEFPDLPALVRVAREQRRDDGARQHLGRRHRVRAVRPAATALGVDISMQALTKYPSGGADVLMGSVTTRDEALHQRLVQRTCAWAGRRRQRRRVGAALAAVARAALRRAGPQRRAAGAWWQGAARGRAGAASGARRLAGPRALGGAVQRRRRACSRWCSMRAFTAGAGRRLRRCAAAVRHRLLVGRAGQPGRAVRPCGDACATAARARHAGALLDRPGRRSTT